MPISRSIFNLGRWRGDKPNALVGNRVDAYIGSVAAGLIGIKSIQSGTHLAVSGVVGDTATTTVSSVSTGKTILIVTIRSQGRLTARLTSSTEITFTHRHVTGSTMWWTLLEFY